VKPCLWLLISVIWILVGGELRAAPLTEELLKSGKKIGFLVGTFDPVTRGHIQLAEAAARAAGLDYVVLVPNPSPFNKSPTRLDLRTAMIDAVAHDSKVIHFPTDLNPGDDAFAWIARVQARYPKTELNLVLGSDVSANPTWAARARQKLRVDRWIIGDGTNPTVSTNPLIPASKMMIVHETVRPTSTDARAYFTEHPELYFEPSLRPGALGPAGVGATIDERVGNLILSRGIYFGKGASNSRTLAGKVAKMLGINPGEAGQWTEWARKLIISRNRDTTRTSESLAPSVGGSVELGPYQSSGARTDIYVGQHEGTKVAVKFANSRPGSDVTLQRAVLFQQWLKRNSSVPVPELLFFDPKNKAAGFEWIDGERLDTLLARGGPLPEPIDRQLRAIHQEALRIYEQTDAVLDLRADNFVVRNGKLYLVDTGPTRYPELLPADYGALLTRLTRESAPGILPMFRCLFDALQEQGVRIR
jgi:cytidyltransferase-like protein